MKKRDQLKNSSLQMAKWPKTEYSGLPLEIRETISQYLDIKSLIALGDCDPEILKRTFTNRLSRTTLKKTLLSELSELCTPTTTPIVTWGSNPPPFPTQTVYESAREHNQEVIGGFLELIDSIHAVMYTENPFLKKDLYTKLIQFIIDCHPPHEDPQYEVPYFYDIIPRPITNEDSCTLCSTEQAVNIEFSYKNMVYCTSLDGWNLLSYSNVQVEFKECIGFPHPLEHAYNPIMGYFDGEYRYPKVSGHNLTYRSIISGQDLKGIYDNIKRNHPPPLNESLFSQPYVELTVNTIIIYSLEGAQAFFAMKEDPRVILRFKQAIYDPRQGQTGITAPSPSPIFWGERSFILPRTIQDPSCVQARTIWTIYHLDQNLTWKKVNTTFTLGISGNSRTRMEITNLRTTPPFKPLKEGDKVIRRIVTQDIFVSNQNIT